MRVITIFAFFLILPDMNVQGRQKLQTFDTLAFYAVMASGSLVNINAELTKVAAASIPEKEAYKGALLMKKAGLLKKATDKLKIFKAGYILLESALKKDITKNKNHFLRLTNQKHAPQTNNKNKEQQKNSQKTQKTFKNLSPVIQ